MNWLHQRNQQRVSGHLLNDEGEQVIDLVGKHAIAYVRVGLWLLLALAMWVLALFVHLDVAWLLLLLGLGVMVWAMYLALDTMNDVFVITTMRVFRISGVFTVKIGTMPISRILDITVYTPLLGRFLNYGHFVFESAAQAQGLREIRNIARPVERDLTIQRVVQRAGLRGRMPPL